jgi:hypothetical protein
MGGAMREAYAGATAGEGSVGGDRARSAELDPRQLAATDPNANVPAVVIGLWVAAVVGFGAYFATVYAPHVFGWVR